MEKEPDPDRSYTLHFVLDGVRYALDQKNGLTKEQAVNNLRVWFPDIEICDLLQDLYTKDNEQTRKQKP